MDNRIPSEVERVAYLAASVKLGEGPSVRCEGPTVFEVGVAREWVSRVMRAQALSTMDNRSPDGVEQRFVGSTTQGLIEEARAWPGNGGDPLSAGHVGALLNAMADRLSDLLVSDRSADGVTDGVENLVSMLVQAAREREAAGRLPDCIPAAQKRLDGARAKVTDMLRRLEAADLDIRCLVKQRNRLLVSDRSGERMREALSELVASCEQTPTIHDDCGTTIITAPSPSALRKAIETLAALSTPKGELK